MKILNRYLIVYCKRPDVVTTPGGLIIDTAISGRFDRGMNTPYPESGVLKSSPKDFCSAYKNARKPVDFSLPKEGDTIYFHHNAIRNNLSESESLEPDHYFVDPAACYFIERDGNLYGMNEFCLVELIPERIEDIKTKSGLFTKSALGSLTQRGILRVKGYDPDGDYDEISPGDIIVWSLKRADKVISLEINGKEYARVDFQYIFGKEDVDVDVESRLKEKEVFTKQNFEYAKLG